MSAENGPEEVGAAAPVLTLESIRRLRLCASSHEGDPVLPTDRMALVTGKLWPRQADLPIAFLDGGPNLQRRVEDAAKLWLAHARLLRFLFGARPQDAAIRISFTRLGSWSAIGRDALQIGRDTPTMNFGWLDDTSSDEEVQRVVLHEFGHALGCIHEHQNPNGGIRWKKDRVYAYYANVMGWAAAKVDANIFRVYDKNLTLSTAVDTKSIMMYPIAPELTEDGFGVGLNTALSDTDKAFIKQHYG